MKLENGNGRGKINVTEQGGRGLKIHTISQKLCECAISTSSQNH